ncbi:hypothetical protein M8J75_004719 [Diaphorina citri]|nr:hypothetical protein M8J75_004719 [Diaphorina citri]
MASYNKILNQNFVLYVRQQLLEFLRNTSTSVKIISAIILFGYFLSFFEEAVEIISVTPGYLLPPVFWLWTAFTFCFIELHLLQVILDLIIVGLGGKLIEPLWGSMEMMTFFAIVNIGVAISSTLFYFFLYMCTFNTDLLFFVRIHGLTGYISGVLVAVKQIMPDHVILNTVLGKMTNRNIPLLVILIASILWLIGLVDSIRPTMTLFGTLVSWIYLRFYQYHTNGTRGDMADNFNFANFFPTIIQPPIAVVCNTIHEFLVRIGLCRKMVRKFDMSVAPSSGITITLPGIDPNDAERRRQLALKALNERTKNQASQLKQDVVIPIPPVSSNV